MKKITLTMLAAVTALQVMANVPEEFYGLSASSKSINVVSKTGETFKSALTDRKLHLPNDADMKESPKTVAPEGEKSYFTTVKKMIVEEDDKVFELETESAAAVLIKQADNKVSLLCPFNPYPDRESVYIDGVIEGDKMKFNLPVIIAEYGPYSLEMAMYRYNAEDHTYCMVEESENVLEVQIKEDGSLSIHTTDTEPNLTGDNDESTFPELVLGVTCNLAATGDELWFIYGTWNVDYSPVSLNSAPEGLVFEDWSFGHENSDLKYVLHGWNHIAGVAIDGSDIYIKGVCDYSPESILKGTIENGIATFSGVQAAGFCDNIDLICYVLSTKAILKDNTIEIILDEPISLEMVLDEENKTLKSKDVMMWCVADVSTLTYLNQWFEPMCIANIPSNMNASLEAPALQDGLNWTSSNMGYLFNYYIPNMNINGCVLDKADIYYNVYLNGKLFTFTPTQFPGLPEDMTDMPADYDDRALIFNQFIYGEDVYGLFFMHENYELYTIGVQSFYQGSDGVLYSSPLNEYNPGFYEPDAVKEIQNENALSVAEEYFTMDGVKVAEPKSGLFVRISRMADGSRKVEKVMK